MNTNVTTTTAKSGGLAKLKASLNAPSVQEQFANALRNHKDTFVASIIDLYSSDKALQTCNPNAVIAECLKAATLQLPINKALGFSYVVVYNNSVKRKDENGNDVLDPNTHKPIFDKVPTPTFIPGYKGYIQLAMRTGKYRTLNADVVYEGELQSYNKLTGAISFDGERKSDKIVGYFCYFELLNGFNKTLYMSVQDMAKYAKRYSPSVPYKTSVQDLVKLAEEGTVGKAVGWMGNFNDMAIKTVVRRLLSKYGHLSVEMAEAIGNENDMDNAMASRNDALQEMYEAPTINVEATTYEEVAPAPVQQPAVPKAPAAEATTAEAEPPF